MEYQTLGKSTLTISRIGFGCMSLKGSDQENGELINKAVETGINFFDTADLYDHGVNEETVGKWLKPIRQNVIIATKAGNQWRKDGSGWDWNPRKEYILACADESLRRLKTDYIDLYQLHGGTMNDPIDETIEAFEVLKQQGKIRFYGISSIRPNVIREYIKRSGIVSVMMQYSLLDRRPEETCFDLLRENNIGVLTRGTVAQGLLIDKPAKDYLGHNTSEVSKAADFLKSLSDHSRNQTQIAIRFALQNPAVTSAIIGVRNVVHLEDAVKATTGPLLSNEEMKKLKEIISPNYYADHR
ncbi:MAG: aldo/keto reductase [Chitinophagaceae bacterium]